MNRQQRTALAQETVQIMERGAYQAPSGRPISIGEALAAATSGTRLYVPEDYDRLLAEVAALPAAGATTLAVSQRTTLAAARSLVEDYPSVACLNFASARNPGGGFLNGSQAQEESLARSSGLYAALQTQPEFYAYHRRERSPLYSDRVIFSPHVPVFRDDDGALLDEPWTATFLTCPAVNASATRCNSPERLPEIPAAMERRTRMVLAVAARHGCAALVLGAWGCGVFGNDPALIAATFRRVLAEPLFAGRFAHVEFAIFDPFPPHPTFVAFERELAAERRR